MEPVEVSVQFRWQLLGQVTIDAGKIVFPKASPRPGLYLFDFDHPEGRATYIGESDCLRRRLQHYRTPGPSQMTNIRLNKMIQASISEGRKVSAATVTDNINVHLGNNKHDVDLTRKLDRVLLEHAAIISAHAIGLRLVNA